MKFNWNPFKKRELNSVENKESIDTILYDNLKRKFALEVSNIGIWDYNATQDLATYSEESKRILGIVDNTLEKNVSSWNDLVHPDDRTKYFKDFKDHLEGKVELYKNVSRLKSNDGDYKWVLDRGKIIEWGENGEAKRVIGVHVDITDTKIKEEKLSQSIDLITKQNNKLKNFAHIATHNLKEHSGNFESLLNFYDESESAEERNEIVNHIKTVALSLKSTINNLRDIVTIDSVSSNEINKLNLSQFIEDGIKTMALNSNIKNAKIENNIASSITINFNTAYLESIIQNLLSNALKYSDPKRTPHIRLNAYNTLESTVFTVEDNGFGIDLNKYGKEIFGLYRTFHSNNDSEGVGLYITKNQVESLGGKIDVSSVVNTGTKFSVSFPKQKNLA